VRSDDDEDRESPPAVIGAVAAGTAPLPFLAVYATVFIVHGGFHHVIPPDITRTNDGELGVGFVCFAIFVIGAVTELWMLNGSRRWPFVVVQAGLLGTAIDFMIDPTKGGRAASAVVILTTLIALVLSAHPQAWDHVGRACPRFVARMFGRRPPPRPAMPAGSGPTAESRPTASRLIGRRRTPRVRAASSVGSSVGSSAGADRGDDAG
jgi:hypothetical protein